MTYYNNNKTPLMECLKARLESKDFKEFYRAIGCPSEEMLIPTISKKGHRSRCFYCTECKKYAYDYIKLNKKNISVGKQKIKYEDVENFKCEKEGDVA